MDWRVDFVDLQASGVRVCPSERDVRFMCATAKDGFAQAIARDGAFTRAPGPLNVHKVFLTGSCSLS